MTPFWISGFLDLSRDAYPAGRDFWREVTGYEVSVERGERGEFATLVPPDADAHLRLQRLGAGSSRIHLDLHVRAPREAADRAVDLGAREVADLGHVVMSSPGGFPFCFVSHPASRPAAAVEWASGHRSLVDQVCLDVPGEHLARELEFWRRLTDRDVVPSRNHPEFHRLLQAGRQTMQLLVQRLEEPLGEVRAHLDLATTDRAAEVARHVGLGATPVREHDDWTMLTDPVGSAYCVTTRRPAR